MNEKDVQGIMVQIFGDEYPIATAEGSVSEVQRVAAHVDQKMQEVAETHGGHLSTSRVAVLAAMEITVELFRAMQERNMVTEKAHENIERLTKLVEERAQMSSVFAARKSSPLERQFLEQPTVQQD